MKKKNKAIKQTKDLHKDTHREIDEYLKIEGSVSYFFEGYGPSKKDLADTFLLDPRGICLFPDSKKHYHSICNKKWAKWILPYLFDTIKSDIVIWQKIRDCDEWRYIISRGFGALPLSDVESFSLFIYGMENYEDSVFLNEYLDKDTIKDLNSMSYSELKEYDSILKSLKGKTLKKSTYLYLNNIDPIYWEWVDSLHDYPLDITLSSLEDLVYIYGEEILLAFDSNCSFEEIMDIIDLYPFFQAQINYIEILVEVTMLSVKHEVSLHKPQLVFLSECPSWCSEEIWEDFANNESIKACEMLLEIKNLLIRKYPPSEYFYICLARDSVPLYVLLFESSLDCMLGVFSRLQVGDIESVNLLKEEIKYAENTTNKKPVIVDVQGSGTIYDYLSHQGINCEKVFAVSATGRYPTLFPVGEYRKEAIKYIEKLPQNTGRPEGVYKKPINGSEEFFIAWGTPDPNAMKAGNNSWSDILQYRGLLYAHMNINPVHAGMIGNSPVQRLWGIYKNYYKFDNIPSVGINIYEDVYTQYVLGGRFKNLFETKTSKGTTNTALRRVVEKFYFGDTRIHPIYGVLTDDRNLAHYYGNIHCTVDIKEVLPYTTVTVGDSLDLYKSDDPIRFWDLLKFQEDVKDEKYIYHEVQYSTLMISSLVKEVIHVN